MKPRSEVYQSLKTQLKSFDEERLAIKTKSQNRFYIFLASVVFSLFLLFTLGVSKVLLPWMVMLAGSICMFTYGWYYALRQGYYRAYKSKVISLIIESINPTLSYEHNNYVLIDDFVNSRIFKKKVARYEGEDWVQGRLGETDFEFSEVHAKYEVRKKGKSTYHTIFKGLFMRADFHKHFLGETFILTDTLEKQGEWMTRTFQGDSDFHGCLVRMENTDFEKEFVVYSTDEVEARYLLSLNIMERILALKKKFDCNIQLSFINSIVHIAIPHSDILELDTEQSPSSQAVVYKVYDELKMCLDIIEDLNLNTRIWSK